MAEERSKLPESQRKFLDYALQDAAKRMKCLVKDLVGEFTKTKEGLYMLSVRRKHDT